MVCDVEGRPMLVELGLEAFVSGTMKSLVFLISQKSGTRTLHGVPETISFASKCIRARGF